MGAGFTPKINDPDPIDLSFFGVLIGSVGKQYNIYPKPRMADVIQPNEKGKRWRAAFNKVKPRHFDFILCEKKTIKILAAIELDDKSHEQKKRKERDEFVEKACQSAQLPLIRIKVKRAYKHEEIRELIKEKINDYQELDKAAQTANEA